MNETEAMPVERVGRVAEKPGPGAGAANIELLEKTLMARPPLMPEAGAGADAKQRQALRTFHLTGKHPDAETKDGFWLPASLTPWLDSPRRWLTFPAHDELLLEIGCHTLLQLYSDRVARHRQAVRTAFCEEVRAIVPALRDRLQLDQMHSREGVAPEKMASVMGEVVGLYLDTESLANRIPAHRGTRRMEPERRRRVEESLATLEQYLETANAGPAFVLVHSDPLPSGVNLSPEATVHCSNAFERALELFDHAANKLARVLRAFRLAHLEVEGRYEPSRHDEALQHSFVADQEWLLVSAVAVWETGKAAGDTLQAYHALLRSRRPIHVLIRHDPMGYADDSGRSVADHELDLPYLSVAHREAFVLQSSLSEPEHLLRGLTEMVKTIRPGVAFVGGQPWSQDDGLPWVQSVAEHQARVSPCFRYDPDAGDTWAESFALTHNPQARKAWPMYPVRYMDGDAETEMTLPISYAECVALSPFARKQFRIVPVDAWGEDQMELSEYLQRSPQDGRNLLPFIWVVDEQNHLQRAILTRELVTACRDRMRAWRVFQELGGIENKFAQRAADRAREEARKDIESIRAEQRSVEGMDVDRVRQEAIQRLVARLLGMEAAPATEKESRPEELASSAPVAGTPPETGKEARPEEPAPVADIAGKAVEEPYIDTPLCTTCDDCIQINPRLFKYNEDKQAYIADAAAGTFAQLVKAAIKCPAACIHPGTPRSDDKTATPALVARAADFN